MARRHRQLRVRNPDVLLLLPATPLAHRHPRILRTLPVDHAIFCFRYPDLHHGLLGSALLSASIGTSVLYATQVHAYSGLGSAWLIYWLGDATGVLLVTPIALTLPRFLRIRDQARI